MRAHHLGFDEAELSRRGALWTAREIEQQPRAWRRTQEVLREQSSRIDAFLKPLLALDDLRIILTGAGSSAYIGDCLAPQLSRMLNRRVEAIATTDLVSGPRDYLLRHPPTLLVSFGRSGNSPESIAAVEAADRCVERCHHLIITCNADGQLYRRGAEGPHALALLLPEETHDRSFAMTSSFSSMLLAGGLALLPRDGRDAVTPLAAAGERVLSQYAPLLRELAARAHARVVFLGSKGLRGLAHEASLKLMELTDGAVVTLAESPLGFRHGPKTIIDDGTLVLVFLSNDAHTRRYDLDLAEELRRDARASRVITVGTQPERTRPPEDHWLLPEVALALDAEWMPALVMFPQLYAFHRALQLGNSPDNPSASGTVNRVVQGVTIHSL
jgi:tagatose-6-phosphate ketose/aldose isomerase